MTEIAAAVAMPASFGIPFLFIIGRMPTSLYPAIFFFLKFVGNLFLDFDRVRYAAMFQLAVICLLGLMSYLKRGALPKLDSKFSNYFARLGLLFFILLGLMACWGICIGNDILQVFIDCYKFFDIAVLYFLFRVSWRNNRDVRTGLCALCVVMLLCGIPEIYLTERGGVGLNLAISFSPVFLTLWLNSGKSNRFILVLCAFLTSAIVFLSKTRTYIIGYALGMVLLMLLLNSRSRSKLISLLLMLFAAAIVLDLISDGNLFGATISRFLQLKEGFEQAGGYRFAELKHAFPIIAAHPALGVGLGFLQQAYIEGMGSIEWGSFIHNAYVEVLLKTGILGFICCLLLCCAIYSMLLAKTPKSARRQGSFNALLCLGALIASASWLLIFFTAPLSTFGSIFVAPTVAALSVGLSESGGGTSKGSKPCKVMERGGHFAS